MSSVTRFATRKIRQLTLKMLSLMKHCLQFLSIYQHAQPIHVHKCLRTRACTHRNVLQTQLSKVSITLYEAITEFG